MSNCTKLFDINNRFCLEGKTTCLTFTCKDISDPKSLDNCNKK